MIYLDYAATTPTDSRIAELVMRLMVAEFGNAGSRTHEFGVEAARWVARARTQIAGSIDCEPGDIIFTSGATESDNLAILGLATHGQATGRRHIVSTAIEHKAVLEPLSKLANEGFEVELVAPDRDGYVASADLLRLVRDDTLLVSVMHANNETGAVQPIGDVAAGLPEHVFMHVDAAQTYGRLNSELSANRINLISLSGHKIFGPKGVGALVSRNRNGARVPLAPLMLGGGQERGLRPGTLPVPLIAGFGLAAELASREGPQRAKACAAIRRDALAAFTPLGTMVHGDENRGVLPNILSLAVPGVDSEAVMVALKDLIAISNGSACTSSRYEPSHVLTAMKLAEDELSETFRLSWGHDTPPVPWSAITSKLDDLRVC